MEEKGVDLNQLASLEAVIGSNMVYKEDEELFENNFQKKC